MAGYKIVPWLMGAALASLAVFNWSWTGKAAVAKPSLAAPADDMQLHYFYDALCGWCYGFSPVIVQFYEENRQQVPMHIYSGGMVVGERIGPLKKMAPYIRKAYKHVEKSTGIEFGDAFFENLVKPGTAVFSSLKPAYALSIVKEQKPAQAISFAARLQRAIYYDGLPPDEPASYRPLATEYGFDADTFLVLMADSATQACARADFAFTAQQGISGFPSVVAQKGDQYHVLTEGYCSLGELRSRFNRVKEGKQ